MSEPIVKQIALALTLTATMFFCLNAHAQMPGPENIDVVTGFCDPSSHTAEGPIGSDLTKRQSRFYCNTAAIIFFPDYKGHVMVQFTQKEAHHGAGLGFAGRLDSANRDRHIRFIPRSHLGGIRLDLMAHHSVCLSRGPTWRSSANSAM